MEKGIVKWFDTKKGYGFITYNEDEEIFVHFTAVLRDGFKFLETNEEVLFEIKKGTHGLQAANVTVLSIDK